MTKLLQLLTPKRFNRNRKGYSGIIATIFMVLILIFMIFNVYMFTQQRNTDFQDTVSIVNQMHNERDSEQLVLLDWSNDTNGNQITVSGTIQNIGPVSVEIIRLWIQSVKGLTQIESGTVGSENPLFPSILPPGETKIFPS